jgi:hypothetical protein
MVDMVDIGYTLLLMGIVLIIALLFVFKFDLENKIRGRVASMKIVRFLEIWSGVAFFLFSMYVLTNNEKLGIEIADSDERFSIFMGLQYGSLGSLSLALFLSMGCPRMILCCLFKKMRGCFSGVASFYRSREIECDVLIVLLIFCGLYLWSIYLNNSCDYHWLNAETSDAYILFLAGLVLFTIIAWAIASLIGCNAVGAFIEKRRSHRLMEEIEEIEEMDAVANSDPNVVVPEWIGMVPSEVCSGEIYDPNNPIVPDNNTEVPINESDMIDEIRSLSDEISWREERIVNLQRDLLEISPRNTEESEETEETEVPEEEPEEEINHPLDRVEVP